MLKLILFAEILSTVLLLGCGTVQVNPGEEAVLTYKPYFWGKGGVDPQPISTGRITVWPSTDATIVNIKPDQYAEEFKDMMTKDDIPIQFSAFIQTRVLNSPVLVEKWGLNWYEKNVKEPFRSIIRDLCKEYSMNELVSSVVVSNKISTESKKRILDIVAKKGIPIEISMVVFGKVSPTGEVMAAITATASQQQRQLTEQERMKTEQFRKGAETERARADKAYVAAMGLSPDLFVKLEGIKSFEKAVDKCAGSQNCTLVIVPPNATISLPNGK